LRVAAVQAAPVFLDPGATTDKAIGLLREAARAGAGVVAFPEVFIAGYPAWLRLPSLAGDDELLKVGHAAYVGSAVRAGGEELGAIAKAAAELGVFVYMGFVERSGSGGSVYASLAAIHPEAGIVGVHRKLKPTFHERLIWSDGDGLGLRVHEWQGVRLGGLNCYENWLPLARQALYAQGEQVHIATWPGDREVTERIAEFIAMEGRVYVIAASGVLAPGDVPATFPLRRQLVEGRTIINNGGSMIVAPGGEVLAGPLVGEAGILYADLDVERVMGEHLKLDPAGHYSRNDVLSLRVVRERFDPAS